MTMQPAAIKALKDNYIWCLIDSPHKRAVVVDPGETAPVLDFLQTHDLQLVAILITHHHWDHTNGIQGLLKQYNVPVYGASDAVIGVNHCLKENDKIQLFDDLTFQAIAIPGHTLDHTAYYGHGMVFSGDTLFTAGCGRIFEGTPTQMYQSLMKLAQLPNETLIYCGHEYTLQNLMFAQAVEPENNAIQQRIVEVKKRREQGKPTVPETLAIEKQTNPFLRSHVATVIVAVQRHFGIVQSEPVDIFRYLRQWKNDF